MREHSDPTFVSGTDPSPLEPGATFESCRFEGYLAQDLAGCRFLDCEFTRCDLSNARLLNAAFRDTRFTACKLVGTDWTQLKACDGLAFRECVLNLANFTGLKLKGLTLEDCVAREALFSDCDLTRANCRGTDFRQAEFNGAKLVEADFRQALNYRIRPGDCLLKKTKFSLPEATNLLYGLDIVLE